MAAAQPDDLGQEQANASGGGMDQCKVARLNRVEVGGEVACGQSLHHDCGRCPVIDEIRQTNQGTDVYRNPFRVASWGVDPGNAISRGEIRHTFADGKKAPCALDAKYFGIWNVNPGHAGCGKPP